MKRPEIPFRIFNAINMLIEELEIQYYLARKEQQKKKRIKGVGKCS